MNTINGIMENRIPGSICRFFLQGRCRFGNRCRFVHEYPQPHQLGTPLTPEEDSIGEACAFSGLCIAVPSTSKSEPPSEADLNLKDKFGPSATTETEALTLVRKSQSMSKSCGICFEVILEKMAEQDQLFGILPSCNHCYCFPCIRKWRQSKEFDFEVTKGCPECRASSDYVFPSKFWFEEKHEKESFISDEKRRMQRIDCRYFRKGAGRCPFGNTCMYLHALPNGKKMDVGPPKPRRLKQRVDEQLVHQLIHLLHDDDDGLSDDDSDDDYLGALGLDLDDPTIAMQYYDRDDIRRYMAIDRLMNPNDSDYDDIDMNFFVF